MQNWRNCAKHEEIPWMDPLNSRENQWVKKYRCHFSKSVGNRTVFTCLNFKKMWKIVNFKKWEMYISEFCLVDYPLKKVQR